MMLICFFFDSSFRWLSLFLPIFWLDEKKNELFEMTIFFVSFFFSFAAVVFVVFFWYRHMLTT